MSHNNRYADACLLQYISMCPNYIQTKVHAVTLSVNKCVLPLDLLMIKHTHSICIILSHMNELEAISIAY